MKYFHSPLTCSLEEVKNSVEGAVDITDMFEFGGPSWLWLGDLQLKKGEEIYIFDHFLCFIF